MNRRLLPFAVALTTALLTPGGMGAQTLGGLEFDVWGVQLTSGQPSLESGVGGGIGVVFNFENAPWLGIGLSVMQVRSNSEREGLSCNHFHPVPAGCQAELLGEQVTLRSYRASLVPTHQLTPSLRLIGGIGLAIADIKAESKGTETGRGGNFYNGPSAHPGGILEAGVAWAPLPKQPLAVVLGARSYLIWLDSCREAPSTYAPFCGAAHLAELRFGLRYRTGR